MDRRSDPQRAQGRRPWALDAGLEHAPVARRVAELRDRLAGLHREATIDQHGVDCQRVTSAAQCLGDARVHRKARLTGATLTQVATFGALIDIGYDRDIVFESFSTAIVDEGLSLACGIWRDTWTDNDPLAAHAKTFIEMKWQEAQRRHATSAGA